MNWERGLKRVWYFILGVICLFTLWFTGINGGAFAMGEAVVYLLLFALCWQLLGAVLLWVVRGFRKGPAEQDTPK